MKKIIISLIGLMLILPMVSAYPVGIPALNLWDVFVEHTFGGFWISVFALCGVFFIILLLGGISAWTNLTYQMVFLLAMAIGYGQAIVIIPLWIAVMSWATFQMLQYINTSSR
ncbi:MAG: hypothetical protein ACHQ1D_00965 [Nitrososphaerales archaeon]